VVCEAGEGKIMIGNEVAPTTRPIRRAVRGAGRVRQDTRSTPRKKLIRGSGLCMGGGTLLITRKTSRLGKQTRSGLINLPAPEIT